MGSIGMQRVVEFEQKVLEESLYPEQRRILKLARRDPEAALRHMLSIDEKFAAFYEAQQERDAVTPRPRFSSLDALRAGYQSP